jgi:hypothetical protein
LWTYQPKLLTKQHLIQKLEGLKVEVGETWIIDELKVEAAPHHLHLSQLEFSRTTPSPSFSEV